MGGLLHCAVFLHPGRHAETECRSAAELSRHGVPGRSRPGPTAQPPPCCAQVVRCPGNLVVSAYVCCTDITATVTPDLKLPGSGVLLHVPLARSRARLGGSALAQAFGQVRRAAGPQALGWHAATGSARPGQVCWCPCF